MNSVRFTHVELGDCSCDCNNVEVTKFIADCIFYNETTSDVRVLFLGEPTKAKPSEPKNVVFKNSNSSQKILRIAFGLLIAIASVWGCQWLFINTGYEFASVITGIVFFISGLAIAGNKAHENW